MIDPVAAIAVVLALIAAYSLGEFIGKERERSRHQRRSGNVLDFTPRLRRVK